MHPIRDGIVTWAVISAPPGIFRPRYGNISRFTLSGSQAAKMKTLEEYAAWCFAYRNGLWVTRPPAELPDGNVEFWIGAEDVSSFRIVLRLSDQGAGA